jgi:NAD(P)-dependent dehydrogenase (short-subunit alcohol dehydrogenase family)
MPQPPQDPADQRARPPLPPEAQPGPGSAQQGSPRPSPGAAGYGRLPNRVALVTGGERGLGRAVAVAFAREGADVAISYFDAHEEGRRTVALVEAEGRRALAIAGDLVDPDHCGRLVEEVVRQLGRLDILVNDGAGATMRRRVDGAEALDERPARTFNVDVLAMFHLTRHALSHMRAGAAVINTVSVEVDGPSAGILDYTGRKAAVVAFTKGLAESLIDRGIRANCVAPGPGWIPLVTRSFPVGTTTVLGTQWPVGRPAQPVEIAPTYVFLASDEGRHVNGDVLGVTGLDGVPENATDVGRWR